MRDPDGLFTAYRAYRALLLETFRDAGHAVTDATGRSLDLVHVDYLARHLPAGAQSIILERERAGLTIDDYWSDHALQVALILEHGRYAQPGAGELVSERTWPAFAPHSTADGPSSAPWPREIPSAVRRYRFHQGLLDDKLSAEVRLDSTQIQALVEALDALPSSLDHGMRDRPGPSGADFHATQETLQ